MLYNTHFEKNRNKNSIILQHKRIEIVKKIDKKFKLEKYPSIENRLSKLHI